MSRGGVIDRMAVRWQAHGFTGTGSQAQCGPSERLIDPARLDRLIDELLTGALGDALAATDVGRDELVCLRSVTVPPTSVDYDRPDADIVATWAAAIAAAIRVAPCGNDVDVVRYCSTPHAVVDLVVRLVDGDATRAWAWRQLGLWPSASADAELAAGQLAGIAADVLAQRPRQVGAALAALAESGRLTRAVALWGAGRTVALVAAAWAAHGGDPRVVAGGYRAASEGYRTASVSDELVQAALTRSVVLRAAADSLRAGGVVEAALAADDRDRLARALAAAAVLDAEPALVCRSEVAGAVVAALATRLAVLDTPGAGGAAEPDASVAEEISPAAEMIVSEAGPLDPPAARTAWAGLLFLLHVVGDLARRADDPADETAGDMLVWPPTRAVLHRLARTLAHRALPDVDAPPADPAVLAFAGLAPDEAPPEPRSDDEPAAVADGRADAVVAALRTWLIGAPLAMAPEPELLAAVVRRWGSVTAEPGRLDVALDLDELSLDVRRAGLDLDPGWIPWLGRVVRFRYV